MWSLLKKKESICNEKEKEKNRREERIVFKGYCKICGEEIEEPFRRITCSDECQISYDKLRKHRKGNEMKNEIDGRCKICGDKINPIRSAYRMKTCSFECEEKHLKKDVKSIKTYKYKYKFNN